jgi:hypothetical protein
MSPITKSLTFICAGMLMVGCVVYAPPAPPQPKVNKLPPFQVILAEKAFSKNGNLLESLDIIQLDDVLIIRNGAILLSHVDGEFIFFEGSQSVNMSELHDSLFGSPYRSKPIAEKRPSIDDLVRSERTIPIKNKSAGIARPNYPDIEIDIFIPSPPFDLAQYLLPQQNLCLFWKPINENHWGNNQFEVNVYDQFNYLIEKFETNEFSIALNLESFFSQQNDLLIVKVIDRYYGLESHRIPIVLDQFATIYTTPCNLQTAAQAVKIGFDLEKIWRDDEATSYFQLATQLSDHKFFDQLSKLHLQRRGMR